MPRVRGAARWLALVALLLLAGGFGARVGGPGLAGAAPARLGTFSRKRTQTSAVNDGARPAAQHGGSAAVDLHGHAEVRAPPKPPAPGGGASERRSHAHSTDVSALPEGQDVYDRATSLMSAGRVEEAVQLLCTQEGYKAAGGTEESYHVVSDLATAGYVGGALDWDGTKIAPSPRREAQGDQRLLRAIEESMRKGLALLEVCGFVAMQGVFPPDLTSELRAEADALLDDHLETLSDGDGTANTAASAARSDGRHELKNPMEGPFIDPRLVLRPVVMRVVQEVTKSANLEIDTHSVVTSLPQTPAQFWHRDLSPPHEMAAAEQDLLLPAAGIVMFVPLTDVTERMGPTGMAAGTHLPCPESLRRYGRLYDQFGPNYYSFDEEVCREGTASCSLLVLTAPLRLWLRLQRPSVLIAGATRSMRRLLKAPQSSSTRD